MRMDIVRRIALKDGNNELILPITPPSFRVSSGIGVETVNIHGLGDVRIAGYSTLDQITINSFFPAQEYGFSLTSYVDPWILVGKVQEWQTNRTVVRFIITGTNINKPVVIENFSVGEQDGSNDVYYTLSMAEYRYVTTTAATPSVTAIRAVTRPVETQPKTPQSYMVQRGDCLRHIAQYFYGDQSYYKQIAELNNIKNPDLIYPGDTLKLPEVN